MTSHPLRSLGLVSVLGFAAGIGCAAGGAAPEASAVPPVDAAGDSGAPAEASSDAGIVDAPTSDTGHAADAGPTGDTGHAADAGPTGDAGPAGDTGPTGDGGAPGDSGAPPADAPPPVASKCVPGTGTDYEVGPGLALKNLADVPWTKLGPGDSVRIHARPTAYKEKIVIMQSGSDSAPLVVCGIPDAAGNLPIIDGNGATSPATMKYPGYRPLESYGVVLITNDYAAQTKYVELRGLDIRGARGASFTDSTGATVAYQDASCIAMYRSAHVTFRGNSLSGCEEGLFFKSTLNPNDITSDILIEGNHFHDLGKVGGYLVHDAYSEGLRVTYQFNYFDDLIAGALGGCLKDRSAGTVIRYNFIRGCQRSIDLVETQDGAGPGGIDREPSYQTSYVYGNVIVYDDKSQGRTVVHYGGDQGSYGTYRKGTVYFYNNTVAILVPGRDAYDVAELFRIDSHTPQGTAEVWNNVVFQGTKDGTPTVGPLALLGVDWLGGGVWGNLHLGKNVISSGFIGPNPHDPFSGTITGMDQVKSVTDPGFVDVATEDFHLATGSPAIALGGVAPAGFDPAYAPVDEWVAPVGRKSRSDALTAGAFEP